MKIKIALLILMCVVACKEKPRHIVVPLSFHDKTEFTITEWSISNDGFRARGEEIGQDGYRKKGWGKTYHVFSCDWSNDGGNLLIEKVMWKIELVSGRNWDGDTTSINEYVPVRSTLIASGLGKHSVYRPIVEALAQEYP